MVRIVGHVEEVVRYPVKSMAGERCLIAEADWQGIEGDRQYGFVRVENESRFPWLTGRDMSDLVRHRAVYNEPSSPRTSSVSVTDTTGRSWSLDDAELAEHLSSESGQAVRLMQLGIGAYDLMPISLVTTASLAAVTSSHGAPLDRQRFRSNIVVESSERGNDWLGKRIRFGSDGTGAELLLAYLAPRCAMVTIDPDTSTRDPSVLRTIAQKFGNAFTAYASVAKPGLLRQGDRVHLLDC